MDLLTLREETLLFVIYDQTSPQTGAVVAVLAKGERAE